MNLEKPNSTFSDRWLDKLLNNSFLSKLKTLFGITEYQIKYLSGNLISNSLDNADLRLSNLTIGQTYRLTQSLSLFQGAAGIRLTAKNNGVNILITSVDIDGGNTVNGSIGESKVFVAGATTVIFDIEGLTSGTVRGNGVDQTFVQLEELPNHSVTTKWD